MAHFIKKKIFRGRTEEEKNERLGRVMGSPIKIEPKEQVEQEKPKPAKKKPTKQKKEDKA